MVIARGQSRESMIPSPIMTAMEKGVIGRFEELTRSTSDVRTRSSRSCPRSTSPSRTRRRQHRLRQARLLHHRHREQPRPRRQRPVLGPEAAVQLRAHPGGHQQAQRGGDRPLPHRRTAAPAPGSSWTCRRRCWTSCCRASPTCGRGGRGHQRRREAGVGAVDRRADRRAGGRDPAQPLLRRPHAAGADARRFAGRLAGPAQPEDLAILNKYWHGVVERAARRTAASGRRSWKAAGDHRHTVVRGRSTPCAASLLDGGRVRRRPAGARRDPDQDRRRRRPALGEELEIFPVCHHSPASALAMVRRLREKQRRSSTWSCARTCARCWRSCATAGCRWRCRRSRPSLTGSRDWGPLSVVAPITGLGRVPGDRLRAGHARRRAGAGGPLVGPRLPVDAARGATVQ